MSDKLEIQGKTVDHAVSEALLQMGARKDEVKITVLEEPRSGFLGILGGRQARVLVERKGRREGGGRRDFRDQDNDHSPHDLGGSGSGGGQKRGRGSRGRRGGGRQGSGDQAKGRSGEDSRGRRDQGKNQQRSEGRPENRSGKQSDQRSDQRPDQRSDQRSNQRGGSREQQDGRSRNRQDDRGRQDRQKSDTRQGRPERSERQGSRGRRDSTEQQGQRRDAAVVEKNGKQEDGRNQNRREPQRESQREPQRGREQGRNDNRENQRPGRPSENRSRPAPVVDPVPDTMLVSGLKATKYAAPVRNVAEGDLDDTINSFTSGILNRAGFPCRCEVKDGDYRQVRVITGDDSAGMLIGRHGSTVDAVEHLIDRMMGVAVGDRVRLNLDINNYRRRREDVLVERVGEAVARVRETERDYHMEPMCARERRLIHLETEKFDAIRTYTLMRSGDKHVVIALDKGGAPDQVQEEKASEPEVISSVEVMMDTSMETDDESVDQNEPADIEEESSEQTRLEE